MKKVFVTRKILPHGLDLLQKSGFEVTCWQNSRPMSADELMIEAQKADALITMLSDSITRGFLEKNSHLKIITNYAVGTNNIDKEAARELGIEIGNTPDVLTEATAELSLGLLIASARNFKSAMNNAENGHWRTWEPEGFIGQSLQGKILGIIGAGRIGKRMAEMARGAFNMDVRFYQRGEDLQMFLKDLDALSLHVPLTPETKEMIGTRELRSMKKTAVLINTARGEVIDQNALYEALKNKTIFAAGLDVTAPEPLEKTHPLYQLENVLILPHIASATEWARAQMSLKCAHNILKVFEKGPHF